MFKRFGGLLSYIYIDLYTCTDYRVGTYLGAELHGVASELGFPWSIIMSSINCIGYTEKKKNSLRQTHASQVHINDYSIYIYIYMS